MAYNFDNFQTFLQDLQRQYLSNAAQSQYILNALGRFVAYPPAAATIATSG